MVAVKDVQFEDLASTWAPKIMKMSQRFIPYMDYDDLKQEILITLWKCQDSYSEDKGAVFHTYFHKAVVNMLSKLFLRVSRHNPDYNQVVYLSTYQDVGGEGDFVIKMPYQLVQDFEISPRVFLENLGFVGLEIDWMIGRMEKLHRSEIAELSEVSVEEIDKSIKSARRNIVRLREGR